MIVQIPATLVDVTVAVEIPLTVVEEPTLQILVVLEVKVTGCPDVAEAVIIMLDPRPRSGGCTKLIAFSNPTTTFGSTNILAPRALPPLAS
jgi:hypothetical protein